MTTAPKSNNGNEDRAASAAANRVSATAEDLQEDISALQDDIMKLSSQIGDLAAAKGVAAWKRARKRINAVLAEAGAKGEEATDAVYEARDHLIASLDDAIESRPYTTLAVALAAGFLAGAMWKR
jgi:ElaB/YqjD/DUF883 family membrane-anchored ribosome-binding protein